MLKMKKAKASLPHFVINAFYESKFRDNVFVVKAGGRVIEDDAALAGLLANIRELNLQGIKVLLVYGGGHAIDAEAQKRGVEVRKHEGKRINAAQDMDVVRHVMGGDMSLRVSAGMQKEWLEGLSFNVLPVGWADTVLAPKTPEDAFTGGIVRVHARPVNRLFRVADFMACACLAVTGDGVVCNINADTVATELAVAIKAHKLIFLSDVDGVQVNGQVAPLITTGEIAGHIASGAVTGGMKVKLENCRTALEGGVRRIHLINGLRENALHKEIYEPVGPGTMLIHDSDRDAYANEVEAQKLIEARK